MLVVRPAQLEDLDPLFRLIQRSELGLSTLKISQEKLSERLEESVRAFSRESARPAGQPYVFVMVDPQSSEVVGTATIYSKVGGFEPFYTYEIKIESKQSGLAGVATEVPYLQLHITHDGPTEIGSLFLSPDYWGGGHGRLLSVSRFLFMADFPERFEDETFAELRGIVHPDGHSPLWDALGSHFFQIDYPRAETLTLESKRIIAELMPKNPIYITLLPEAAQDVIGKVHQKTIPALKLLEQEGFEIRNFVDIFDGGPTVHCTTREIRSIRNSRIATVSELGDPESGDQFLVSNQSREFRCVNCSLQQLDEDRIRIQPRAADLLNIQLNDPVRFVEMRPPEKK